MIGKKPANENGPNRDQSQRKPSFMRRVFARAAGMPSTEKPSQTGSLRRAFTPGETWLDTAGRPIQAHGGSILQVNGTYYWYGENKEFTTGKTHVWTWGVRCYSSSDLYNWEDLGLIIPPNAKDRSSPLHPAAGLDRPHIIYNRSTDKFVCWIKLLFGGRQTRTVLTADEITGPYTIVHQGIQPFGMSAGDFDLAVDPEDDNAYMYFERVHSELICADLTADYTGFDRYYSSHFPRLGPPQVREAPAYFSRHGKHHLITSGTTSYFPNPSEVAVADTFHGPFTVLGDLHPGDPSRSSFNSQISSVFQHPLKEDLYIALADRWKASLSGAEFERGQTSRLVQSAFAKSCASPPQRMTSEERDAFSLAGIKIDASAARYVWLPLRFDGHKPVIEWRSQWSLDEFA